MSEVPLSQARALLRVLSSVDGPVDPSFRALSGRLQIQVRSHMFNEEYLSLQARALLRVLSRQHVRHALFRGIPES